MKRIFTILAMLALIIIALYVSAAPVVREYRYVGVIAGIGITDQDHSVLVVMQDFRNQTVLIHISKAEATKLVNDLQAYYPKGGK